MTGLINFIRQFTKKISSIYLEQCLLKKVQEGYTCIVCNHVDHWLKFQQISNLVLVLMSVGIMIIKVWHVDIFYPLKQLLV